MSRVWATIILVPLFFFPVGGCAQETDLPPVVRQLVDAALERTRHEVVYDGSYRSLSYPGGDVPDNVGVCTDVIIRSYRALGIDLQELVHEDMTAAFGEYPRIWGLENPDPNIDHRRVPNLQKFFARQGAELGVTSDPGEYRPGDVVTWLLPGNLPHIGIVVDRWSSDGRRPLVVHNIGGGPILEDALFSFEITGHYRYLPSGGRPGNSRSQEAIAAVQPGLVRDLRAKELTFGSPIFIRIFKESKELELWLEKGSGFELFRVYEICAYSGDLGPKLRQGDGQSPEGFYFVTPGSMNPSSRFHLSFNLGYPNAFDRHQGRTGSAIMVHGNCVSIGCYAMTDAGIEEIYALAAAALGSGQPFFRVHVFPFRMTDSNLEKQRTSRWAVFWRNLKEGYDAFEDGKVPPNVLVQDGKYVFEVE